MALDPQVLAAALRDLSNNRPATVYLAARRWSRAYATYARSATALDALAVIPPTSDAALETAFAEAMHAQNFLSALPAMLTAYWVTPPIPFAGPANAGVVAAVTGAPALSTGISAFMAANVAGAGDQLHTLDALAALCHAFTTTVIATLTNLQSGVVTTATIL